MYTFAGVVTAFAAGYFIGWCFGSFHEWREQQGNDKE